MHDPRAEGARWLDQAENDLAFARHALQGEFYHQVCFAAQQCVGKALKAVLHSEGAPHGAFTRSQAERAIASAAQALGAVKAELAAP